MFLTRAKWTLALFTWLAAAGAGLMVHAAETEAETQLSRLGLKHSGIILVLAPESDVHAKTDELRRLSHELSNAVMRQRGTLSQKDYQDTLKELDLEIQQLNTQINSANQMIASVPKYRGRVVSNFAMQDMNEMTAYKNQLQWEVQQRKTFLNQLKSRPFDPKARAKVDADVEQKRSALQQAAEELRTLVDSTLGKYSELAKDPQFKKVLAALEKGKKDAYRLGPSRQFQNDVKQLERVEHILSPASGGTPAKAARTSRGKARGKRAAPANDGF